MLAPAEARHEVGETGVDVMNCRPTAAANGHVAPSRGAFGHFGGRI
jgi:hypothetical protein